ncbi:MAG: hypothetical protein LBB45_06410 [Methanobrevibacter sp.]|jgi:TM2 domain-containing membrane protein YozV|nr:hypothetical protein [Candidatus Methanovirga basalitermitum]
MNSQLTFELMLFKEQLEDINGKDQILILSESKKKNNWWMSIIPVPGLWQMCNGSVAFGICLFLFGWLLFIIGGYIWGIANAYNTENEFNSTIDLYVLERLREIGD